MSEQWPVTQLPPRPALPTVEELPRAGNGYSAERVEEAFDAFYRHIARLDATLQALEAAEAFSRQASDLRNELRAFRRARWQESWSEAYGRSPAAATPARLISPALPRVVVEVAFLIAVAVILGIRHFSTVTIVGVMAGAWLIVGLTEWFVSHDSGGPTFDAASPLSKVLPPVARAGWDDEGLTMVAELDPSNATRH
jgi:hypothetical protein